MAITSIKRDWVPAPSIIRILSTSTLAQVGAAGYLTAQAANIEALNNGTFEWDVSDFVLVYASDGWGFYSVLPDFTGLTAFSFTTAVTGPTVVGDFASFNSTSGNLIDSGYSPSDATKTKVVMAGSAVVVNHIAKFVDTAGTIDDTAGAAINSGNIQAGLSGTAGTLISYPATLTSGSLILAGVANSANVNVTLSNASHAQASVYSIPDGGQATSNILTSNSATTQTIATGNLAMTVGYLQQSAVNGLTALAGGAQAGTALTRQINRVTTVATAADSVQLPAAIAGRVVTVINAAAANAMAVFPQTGEIINALAANASISVAANKVITFYCAVNGTWNSQLTA